MKNKIVKKNNLIFSWTLIIFEIFNDRNSNKNFEIKINIVSENLTRPMLWKLNNFHIYFAFIISIKTPLVMYDPLHKELSNKLL